MAGDGLCLGSVERRLFLILDPILGTNRFILPDDRVMGWVAARIPGIGSDYKWVNAKAIGLVENGEILAGMVVHDYVPAFRNCQLTFAATNPKWANRKSITAMLRYPFQQLGCDRVTTIIASTNKRAIKFNLGIGFVQEGCCRHGWGDDDALIFGLLKSEIPEWMRFT